MMHDTNYMYIHLYILKTACWLSYLASPLVVYQRAPADVCTLFTLRPHLLRHVCILWLKSPVVIS